MAKASFLQEKLGNFPHFLIYAILECVVIILIFVDGFFAFLSNEFARLFELRIPCLLCTRIDHLLVSRDSSFYYNESICEVHKKDISSLTYCNVHSKLSDFHNMCQGCLLSEKACDCHRYKSLVGMLHKRDEIEDDDKYLMEPLNKDEIQSMADYKKTAIMKCCCCGDHLKSRLRGSSSPTHLPQGIIFNDLKLVSDFELGLLDDKDASNVDVQCKGVAATVAFLQDTEDINECGLIARGNKFFGIPLSDSAQLSPRCSGRGGGNRKLTTDNLDLFIESNDPTQADNGDLLTRLKRQIYLDREALTALHIELDEERSAAAVAASNAMAMITRLQSEKGTVQMEALHYQRMSEEQSDYDQEALQVMKDIVFECEEEIEVLEVELEMYREKYGTLNKLDSEVCEVDTEDYQDMKLQAMSSTLSENLECGSSVGRVDDNGNEHPFEQETKFDFGVEESSFLDFGIQRTHLLSLLSNIEQKGNTPSDEISNSIEGEGKDGHQNKESLTRHVLLIRESLRAIEADSNFLKQVAITLQKGSEGTKLLVEIADHLRSLRQLTKSPLQVQDE